MPRRDIEPGASMFLYFLAIIAPPVAIGILEGCKRIVLLNVVLWIFGWFPGVIHACYCISRRTRHKDDEGYFDLEASLAGPANHHNENQYPRATPELSPVPHGVQYQWVQVQVPVHYVPALAPCCIAQAPSGSYRHRHGETPHTPSVSSNHGSNAKPPSQTVHETMTIFDNASEMNTPQQAPVPQATLIEVPPYSLSQDERREEDKKETD